MESSGLPDRIHISAATADELRRLGKEHWLMDRLDAVTLKGKGQMKTYWALPRSKSGLSSTLTANTGSEQSSNEDVLEDSDIPTATEKRNRLIEWNVEVLMQHLQPVVNSRVRQAAADLDALKVVEEDFLDNQNDIVVSEMTSVLSMPKFDPLVAQAITRKTPIPDKVKEQLRQYVYMIASTYRDTPFRKNLQVTPQKILVGFH
jgi:hypothetical protein